MHDDAMKSLAHTLQKLREVSSSMGISVAQAADVLRNLALEAQKTTVMFGDADREKKSEYKTLNYKHEVL